MLMIVIVLIKGKENCEKKLNKKLVLALLEWMIKRIFFFFFGKNLLLQKHFGRPHETLFFFYFVFL